MKNCRCQLKDIARKKMYEQVPDFFKAVFQQKGVQTTNMGQAPRQKAASPGFRWSHRNCSYLMQSPSLSPGVVWVMRRQQEVYVGFMAWALPLLFRSQRLLVHQVPSPWYPWLLPLSQLLVLHNESVPHLLDLTIPEALLAKT